MYATAVDAEIQVRLISPLAVGSNFCGWLISTTTTVKSWAIRVVIRSTTTTSTTQTVRDAAFASGYKIHRSLFNFLRNRHDFFVKKMCFSSAIVGIGTTNPTTATPYTVTTCQAGLYLSYNNAAAGVINLPSLATISDGWQVTIMRKVARSVTITANGADSFPSGITTLEMQAQNLQSVTLTKNGSNWAITNRTDDCIVGQSCWGTGNIYIGTQRMVRCVSPMN